MKTYTYEGRTYRADEPVDWKTALGVGGFYFLRARHLGLPEPPAAFLWGADGIGVMGAMEDPETTRLVGEYHTLFTLAEAKAVSAAIGRRAGSVTGGDKAKAARRNGKLGGRPKKKQSVSVV